MPDREVPEKPDAVITPRKVVGWNMPPDTLPEEIKVPTFVGDHRDYVDRSRLKGLNRADDYAPFLFVVVLILAFIIVGLQAWLTL
jgi:hypothetical protein